MKKQVIHTILLFGLLCAATLAQRAEIIAEDQFVNSCANARSMLLDIVVWHRDKKYVHEVPIWRFPDNHAFFFISGMSIDADGAPNAYHPDDTGLDELANAGSPTDWNGVITDREGNPLIQEERDPFPGYYISCTSLADKTKEFTTLDPFGAAKGEPAWVTTGSLRWSNPDPSPDGNWVATYSLVQPGS